MANLTVRNAGLPILTERDPFKAMRELMNWDPFTAFPAETRLTTYVPAFDVKETKDAYTFKADMPGVKDADLEVTYQGNQLFVRGKREQEKEDKGDTWYTYERSYGSFARAFTLPTGIDTDHANAELKDGVLTIAIPKKPEAQAKRIAVAAPKAKS